VIQIPVPRLLAAADPAGLPAERVDVLVVGSGIAGLSLALHLAGSGRSVLLVTKGTLGESSTCYAQGGIAVALDGPGSADASEHARDTLAVSAGLGDPAAAGVLAAEAAEAVAGLQRAGVRFDRTAGGALARTREGGHTSARIVHAGGDATGAGVISALTRAVCAAGHIRVAARVFLIDLLDDGHGRVTGALLHCGRQHGGGPGNGTLRMVRAGAVVLASGGAGQLYDATTNPPGATGDGLAAALRAGAELADLEFVQFHPTALRTQDDPRPLVSEALRGEGAVLRGPDGERFMADAHPLAELAPRDVVTRAMADRMAASRTDHLLLDATHLGRAHLEQRFPTVMARCRAAGLDPAAQPIPVAPAAHYLMGGIRTDLFGRTSLEGLYAVGEAACTGVHGANRLASNSLLEGLVFAARTATALTTEPGGGLSDPVDTPGSLVSVSDSSETGGPPSAEGVVGVPKPGVGPGPGAEGAGAAGPPLGRARLRRAMTRDAGVLRSREGLARAAAVATALASPPATATPQAWETANLAQVALVVTALAARRTESRGAHWRSDHPEPDPAWQLQQVTYCDSDGDMVIRP
jgi:L-aspartate oxidase